MVFHHVGQTSPVHRGAGVGRRCGVQCILSQRLENTLDMAVGSSSKIRMVTCWWIIYETIRSNNNSIIITIVIYECILFGKIELRMVKQESFMKQSDSDNYECE